MEKLTDAHLDQHLQPLQTTAANLLLMLDFDGTLAPFSTTPHNTPFPPTTRSITQQLAHHPRCTVAIVSGRSLEDLERLCPLDGVYYGADHGVRLRDPQGALHTLSDTAAICRTVQAVYQALDAVKDRLHPSVFVENKPYSVAMHVRRSPHLAAEAAYTLFRKIAPDLDASGIFHFLEGNQLLEFRPADLHKGLVVKDLRKRLKHQGPEIFVGDDTTDEDAFRVLSDSGAGIRVGHNPNSAAPYWVEDQACVEPLLGDILRRLP